MISFAVVTTSPFTEQTFSFPTSSSFSPVSFSSSSRDMAMALSNNSPSFKSSRQFTWFTVALLPPAKNYSDDSESMLQSNVGFNLVYRFWWSEAPPPPPPPWWCLLLPSQGGRRRTCHVGFCSGWSPWWLPPPPLCSQYSCSGPLCQRRICTDSS